MLGTAWASMPAGAGRFDCPRCGEERDYVGTALQRFLTVFRRPVLKLGGADEYVTCQLCGHAYPASVLSSPPEEDRLAEDELAFLSVVAAMIFSDSVIRRSEKSVAREIIRRYTGRAMDGEEMDRLLERARLRWGDPIERLSRLRWLVPREMRRRIVAAAYHICTADGELHREESRLLDRIGDALDLPPRQLRQALTEAKRNPIAQRG
jgi:uncharacterized tellurite resistance protein B-like protein